MFSSGGYGYQMSKENLRKAGWLALMLIVPGGLVLGAAVAAHKYRKKATGKAAEE
jgi:H+/Cl- antiporter ClcA